MESGRKAYIVRVFPAQAIDNLPDTLERNQVSIGWANLNPEHFYHHGELNSEAVKKECQTHYPSEKNAPSSIEKFFSINKGDLVLIPAPNKRHLYAGIIKSEKVIISNTEADSQNERRFRHDVVWLNDKQPISYDYLPERLHSKLKQHTVINIDECFSDIFEALLREKEKSL